MSKRLIGTDPNQIPLNTMLGNMAFQSKENVTLDNLGVKNAANVNVANVTSLIANSAVIANATVQSGNSNFINSSVNTLTSNTAIVNQLLDANTSQVTDLQLKGDTVQSLYRSGVATPSTVFIYDTSKDSDGGAWTKKCQNTSWYNEAIVPGKWIGSKFTESDARQSYSPRRQNLLSKNIVTDYRARTGFLSNVWYSNDGSVLSIDTDGAIRASRSYTTYMNAASGMISVEVGKTYIFRIGYLRGALSGGGVYRIVGFTDVFGSGSFSYGDNQSSSTYVFQATSPFILVEIGSLNSSASDTVTFDDFSLEEFDATQAASGDYFQNLDGSYYRLYKNLIAHSESFDSLSTDSPGSPCWSKSGSSISANATSSPIGTLTADTLLESTSATPHGMYGWVTGLSSVAATVTLSVYAKSAGRNNLSLRMWNGASFSALGGAWAGADFNLSTVASSLVSSSTSGWTSLSSSISDEGNGWYRCSVTLRIPQNAYPYYTFLVGNGSTFIYAGNDPTTTPTGIHLWGAQCEHGSSVTSYEFKGNVGSVERVFRGNKRDFPRLAAIVCAGGPSQVSKLSIHDLTEPGFPMWMDFRDGPSGTTLLGHAVTGAGWQDVHALNGILVGSSGGQPVGLNSATSNAGLVDFINDFIGGATAAAVSVNFRNDKVSDRNAIGGWLPTASTYRNTLYTNNSAQADVSMTVLPDAPVDSVTGLPYPTIAMATSSMDVSTPTSSGLNGFAHGSAVDYRNINIRPRVMIAQRLNNTQSFIVTNPGRSSAVVNTLNFGSDPDFSRVIPNKIVMKSRSEFIKGGPVAIVQHLMNNENDIANGLTATITNTYNTGYQPGSIRRTYLSDIDAGTINGNEPVVNPKFATDLSGWKTFGIVTWVGPGNVSIGTGLGNIRMYQQVTVVPGQRYVFTADLGTSVFWGGSVYIGNTLSDATYGSFGSVNGTITRHIEFTPTQSTIFIVVGAGGSDQYATVRELSLARKVFDRSFKGISSLSPTNTSYVANTIGTLTKTAVASNAQLVAYSGFANTAFSSNSFIREIYSSDLDFGTGEWSASAWVCPPGARVNLLTYTEEFNNAAWNTDSAGSTVLANQTVAPDGTSSADFLKGTGAYGYHWILPTTAITGVAGLPYTLSVYAKPNGYNWVRLSEASGGLGQVGTAYFNVQTGVVGTVLPGGTARITNVGNGWYRCSVSGISPDSSLTWAVSFTDADNNPVFTDNGTGGIFIWGAQLEVGSTPTNYQKIVSGSESFVGTIFTREFSSGANISLTMIDSGNIRATVHDGTTTRTLTTTGTYNDRIWIKPEVCYQTDGTLSIRVNGQTAARTFGTPLLTLNNSNAALTIGANFANTNPFWGQIALLKIAASVPSLEHSRWMYEQEKELFTANTQCCLADSGSVQDVSYDEATNRWISVSNANRSEWAGLVRAKNTPTRSSTRGLFVRTSATGGVQTIVKTSEGANSGVDVILPKYTIREELVNRAERAARLSKELITFDYTAGFNGTVSNANTAITSVTNLSYPTLYLGARITANTADISANTFVSNISGTTIYMSRPAVASNTGIQISFTDFILPAGYEAKNVIVAGTMRQEGATKDWIRLFDGIKETIRLNVTPAFNALVQIQAVRSSEP